MQLACNSTHVTHIQSTCITHVVRTWFASDPAIALAKKKESNAKKGQKTKKNAKKGKKTKKTGDKKSSKCGTDNSSAEKSTKDKKRSECGTDNSSADIQPQDLTARAVMHFPDLYLPMFVEYWCDEENSPCVQGVSIPLESLQIWRKGKSKKAVKLAQHRFLPGICRMYGNKAFDFCISKNLIPVVFDAPDDESLMIDMVKPFTCAFWCCYCNLMEDEPSIESDDCQLVR